MDYYIQGGFQLHSGILKVQRLWAKDLRFANPNMISLGRITKYIGGKIAV